MRSRLVRVTLWLTAGLLLLSAAWCFDIATYNWFAADSNTAYSHAYASRGNTFFLVALVLFVGFTIDIIALVRSRKKREMRNT